MKILVLNVGSSSLKCELYQAKGPDVHQDPLWQAQADWKELPGPATLAVRSEALAKTKREIEVRSLEHTVEELLGTLTRGPRPILSSFDEIAIAGHRVVHGGDRFRESTFLNEDVRGGIQELAPFAPLHNPLALQVIEACDQVLGRNRPQVAVFDTSFHRTLPPEAYTYPGPREWLAQGIRRYGFHGISHRYVFERGADLLAPVLHKKRSELRVITCHLGNGCSLCAIKGGNSVETTMGFTPMEGVVMGTRSGTVDPGLLIYLLKHSGCTADQLDRTLNQESGLKGLSGVSGDMRQVSAAAEGGNADARQALEVYQYRLAYFISALVPSLSGVDALLFAGGIGENSASVRANVCRRLAYLGIELDAPLNEQPASDRLISAAGSRIAVGIVQTRENYQIARECVRLYREG